MKTASIVLHIIFIFTQLYSQNLQDAKRDHQWVTGTPNPINKPPAAALWDFNSISAPSIVPFSFQTHSLGASNTCISDTLGELILFSTGFDVKNKHGITILNGDSLSFGAFYTNYPGNLDIYHGVVILPLPGSITTYYVFHQRRENSVFSNELLFTTVVLNEITGEYEVLTKNNRIILDTLAFGFEVSRHANGRDWWLIQPCLDESRFYKVLFTPVGIYSVNVQMITPQFGNLYNNHFPHTEQNPSTISPDGNYYVKASFEAISAGLFSPGYVIIRVFNFDRCSGVLYNQRSVITDTMPGYYPMLKLCVSPNSKYLYFSYCLRHQTPDRESMIYQYDLSIPDYGQTKQMVAEYDGYIDSIGNCILNYPLFHTMQIGPDQKIYVDGKNSLFIHVIENPDNPGLSCNFSQRKITLYKRMNTELPHFPNHRLGPLSGSVCDSLTAGIEVLKPAKTVFSVFPNPVADHLQVSWDKPSGGECGYYLINSLGAVIQAASFRQSGQNYTISLREVPEGMYLLRLFSSSGEAQTQKLVVLRP